MLNISVRCLVLAAALSLTLSPVLTAQSEATIAVTGNIKQPLVLSASDLAKMPRTVVSTTNSNVVTAFEGVLLSEVLKKAGFPPGEDLAGYVLASSSDGYQALFSIAELDPTIADTQVIIADKANGNPLPSRDGAFRLVSPKDVRAVRSVRQLAKLEVVLLNSRSR